MITNDLLILIAMCIYMLAVISIGVIYAKRASQSSENYFLGGRGLGPWVTAMSAEASDMSGWLLMGLPGVAYWCGLAEAFWTAAGLALGTYLNWLIVSKRLRRYSIKANNAITLPEFFSNRFHETKPVLLSLSAVFILVFFTVYASSCMVTCGKLFSTLFGAPYVAMLIVGALFVLIYTWLGGFLAESASDFMQALVMIFALLAVGILGVVHAGGFSSIIQNAKNIPGFLEFFNIATPITTHEGVQLALDGVPQFGSATPYSILTICSLLAWGLGYFGMPQVLLRFMAIRSEEELTRSRRIATVWVIISLTIAVFLGIIGRHLQPTGLTTASSAENIFILLSETLLNTGILPLFAGFIMAGILAATISSSDSYLLIAASAVAKNIYSGILKKDASDKQVMIVSRVTLILIAVISTLIACDENNIIFRIVSFAWAGFGATFGPIMLFSLFWKRTTRSGAVAGMVGGAAMVFLWKLVISNLGGVFAIYELLPAFIFSSVCIIVVSLLSPAPSAQILKEFDEVRAGK